MYGHVLLLQCVEMATNKKKFQQSTSCKKLKNKHKIYWHAACCIVLEKAQKICMDSSPVAPVWIPIINKQCMGFKVLKKKTNNNKQTMYGLTTCCTSLTPRATPCQLPPCSLYGRLEICLPFFKDLRFVCLFFGQSSQFSLPK